MSDKQTLQFYECHAAGQAEAYNSVTSPAVQYFHRTFNPGCRVLDVGCGSGGSGLISFPVKYPGISEGRDGKGRLFHIRPVEEIERLLERIGFDLVEKWFSDDVLSRGETDWCTLFGVKKLCLSGCLILNKCLKLWKSFL